MLSIILLCIACIILACPVPEPWRLVVVLACAVIALVSAVAGWPQVAIR